MIYMVSTGAGAGEDLRRSDSDRAGYDMQKDSTRRFAFLLGRLRH